jgi:glycosyltransferase involved in cell wall biosynthesis
MSAASDCAVHEVSVVIPVHNGESFVRAAIDSVLAQSGCAVEVIVVDSASSDRSSAVVKEAYGARVILAKEDRPGAARARNAGARLASRPWLAFLDADDVWLPEKLAKQIAAAEAAPGCDLVFTLGEEFLDGELSEKQRMNFSVRPLPYALLTPSSLLLRRETFLAAGEFPDVPAGEFIAWQGWARELGLREQVAPEVLVRRRIHAHNMTRSASNRAGYPMAAKWLLDRRRQRARSFATQI